MHEIEKLVREFVSARCDLDPEEYVRADIIYSEWLLWLGRVLQDRYPDGLPGHPTSHWFGRQLTSIGFGRQVVWIPWPTLASRRVWVGIRLKEE